jgi:hypothetical protein
VPPDAPVSLGVTSTVVALLAVVIVTVKVEIVPVADEP